jgi:hypothetical protein
MADELEGIWKEAVFHLLGGTEKTTRNLRIPDIPADIRTEHLPDKSLERYR